MIGRLAVEFDESHSYFEIQEESHLHSPALVAENQDHQPADIAVF